MAVKKVDAPLLIIGLGGTGSEAAYNVKRAFADRLEIPSGKDCPRRTRFLIIDTDGDEKNKFGWKDNEFFSIANSYASIKDSLQAWEKMWFDPHFSDPEGMLVGGTGAGIYRQISRLFLFRRVDQLCSELENAIKDVLAVEAGEQAGKKLEIRVLAGISGGTGSGTILDVPYLVRYVLEKRLHRQRHEYALEGMLVLPDVTIAHHAQGDTIKTELYETNGYAALKEIDFWMFYESHKHKYRQQYSHNIMIEWQGRPYDDLILLNASMLRTDSATGSIQIKNPYPHIMNVIAEYLVNCFSGDYDKDNGLREFNKSNDAEKLAGEDEAVNNGKQAEEDSDKNSAPVKKAMTFEAMRSNDLAQLRSIRKEYFVPYCYRSIGAFSNTGDMANILNRQWNMILDATILRIDRRESVANMEGTAPITLKTVCIDKGVGVATSSALRTFYEEKHGVDDVFGNMTAADLRVRNYNNAPHGDEFEAWKETLAQQKGDDQLALEEKGRELLHSVLADVVCDLERGPQHCYDLLEHPIQGLIVALEEEKKNAQSKKLEADAFVRDHSGASGICNGIMTEMKNLGIIRWGIESARRFDQYKESVIDLYNAAQASSYYAALYDAMTELIKYVEEYKSLLGDIITGLRTRQMEYSTRVDAAKVSVDVAIRLLDDEKVEQSLTAAFNDQKRMEGLVKTAYKTVADAVDKAQAKNQTSYTEREVAELIREGIDSVRRDCFSKIDTMNIEAKLSSFGTLNGQDMASYTEKIIMPKLERGATPMFNSSFTLKPSEGNVVMSYMGTIPAQAPKIQAGIAQYMASHKDSYANIKLSNIPDRLFWVTSIVGMPMMAYAGLQGMYGTYLRKSKSHSAHSCMNSCGALEDIQQQDWSLLPEPTCNRYRVLNDAETKAKAMHEAGVLDINVTFQNMNNYYVPDVVLKWKRLKPNDGKAYITTHDTAQNIESALAGKTSMDDRITALEELRNKFDWVSIELDKLEEKAQQWANVLDIGVEVSTLIGVELPDNVRTPLQDAWRLSYERATYEYVSRNPQLLGYMRTNKECLEMIDARIMTESAPDPKVVAENAAFYGRLFRFGLIRQTGAGTEYVSKDVPDEDCMIYSYTSTDVKQKATLEKLYHTFGEYSRSLRSLLCYIQLFGGKCNLDQIQREYLAELEIAYNALLRDLSPYEVPDMDALEGKLPGLKSYIINARNLAKMIQSEKSRLTTIFAQAKITVEEKNALDDLLNQLMNDNNMFLESWENATI